MKHTGGCHCGNVKFEFEADIKEVMDCNCSICIRRGHLMAFVPESQFKSVSEKSLGDYQWGKKSIHFMFCQNCGIPVYGKATAPDGTPTRAVNARCLDDVDLSKFKVVKFDGKSV